MLINRLAFYLQKGRKQATSVHGESQPVPEKNNIMPLAQDQEEIVVFLKNTVDTKAKWRSWWVRVLSSLVMAGAFIGLIFLGHFYLIVLIMLIVWRCFHEIKSIGWDTKMKSFITTANAADPTAMSQHYNIHFYFKNILRLITLVGLYFLYAPIFLNVAIYYYDSSDLLKFALRYHNFISFSAYIASFVVFVLSLRRGSLLQQFSLFGFIHVLICFLGSQTTLIIQNIMEGLIWFLLPAFIVIINDCTAYIFGFFFGATRLIDLSPKKTWEGFLGALVSTLVLGTALGYAMSFFPSLTCPITELRVYPFLHGKLCEVSALPDIYSWHRFSLAQAAATAGFAGHHLPASLAKVEISYIPIVLHSFFFSLFGSTVAPFGGFFASGFKRALGVKDFSNTLPGHGGFMDRFDCQLLMGTFVYVYYTSFIRSRSYFAHNLLALKAVLRTMDHNQRLELYNFLKDLI